MHSWLVFGFASHLMNAASALAESFRAGRNWRATVPRTDHALYRAKTDDRALVQLADAMAVPA